VKRIVLFVPLLLAAVLLPTPAQAGVQAAATVTFVNAVTYDFDNDFELTVCVDDESVADNLSTGASTEPLAVDAGEHFVSYVQGTDCADDGFVEDTISFDAAANLTVMAWWGTDDRGISVFENDISCIEAGTSRVTLRNGSAAGNVDLVLTPEGGTADADVAGVAEGEEGSAEVEAGDYELVLVEQSGGGDITDFSPQSFADGTSYVIYVYGGNDGAAGASFGPELVDPCSTTTTAPTTTTAAAAAAAATVRPTFTG
jgi:hypothetical protein